MFRHGSSLADSTATAKGVIAFRAPRRISGDLATMLPGPTHEAAASSLRGRLVVPPLSA
jgi:hypothetical protein